MYTPRLIITVHKLDEARAGEPVFTVRVNVEVVVPDPDDVAAANVVVPH